MKMDICKSALTEDMECASEVEEDPYNIPKPPQSFTLWAPFAHILLKGLLVILHLIL